ncbi:MAG: TerB family tellurite resistance protein [Myxococcota bacterium]
MSLLERVREVLGRQSPLAKDAKGEPADLEIMAAAAVLLLEAAYGDADYVWREERVLVRGLERAFGIGREETYELLGRADEIRPPVVKLADVTELLASRYDVAQREQILALLWRVIRADGVVEPWEEIFGRHVSEALGLGGVEGDQERAAR